MRERRFLKMAAYAAAGLAGLLLAALLSLRVLFPPEKVKGLAVERLSAALGRQVRVAAVSIGLRGADLRGVEVSERPDFSAGTLVVVEHLRVSARWLPMLLEKRFEAGGIWADGWTLSLTSSSFQTASVGERERPRQAPSDPRPGPEGGNVSTLSVSRLQLDNGLIRYGDPSKGLTARASGVHAKASELGSEKPFPLSLSFTLQVLREGSAPLSARFDFNGRFDPARGEPARMSLEADPLRFDLAGLPVSARGTLKDFFEPELNLRWEAGLPKSMGARVVSSALGWTGIGGKLRLKHAQDGLKVREFSMEREGFSLTASGSVLGLRTPKPRPDFKLSLNAKVPSLPALAVRTAWPSFPPGASLPPVSVRTACRWQGEKSLSFSQVELGLGGLAARLRGRLSWEGSPRMDLDLETGAFEVSEFTPFFPAYAVYGLRGKTRLKLHAAGPLASPAASGEVHAQGLGFSVSSHTFSDLSGDVRFSPGSADARLKGRWNSAEVQLSLDAKGLQKGSPERELRVEGGLSELDLASFASGPAASGAERAADAGGSAPKPAPALKTSGRLSIGRVKHPNFETEKADLAWDLRGLSKGLSALEGSVKLRTGPGRFEDLGLLASQNPLVKTALLPFLILQRISGLVKVPLFPAFDRAAFKEITGDYAFQNGVMTVKESHLDGSQAYVAVTGTADLARDALDLRLSTKLGTQVGLKLSGPVGITVKGSLSDPKVSVDPLSIIQQPGVDKVIEGGRKMLEEGGKKLLEGIFKQ